MLPLPSSFSFIRLSGLLDHFITTDWRTFRVSLTLPERASPACRTLSLLGGFYYEGYYNHSAFSCVWDFLDSILNSLGYIA
jgi:hypothetical protein